MTTITPIKYHDELIKTAVSAKELFF
jgi:hypothetical protein